jgi:cytidylate kinase
MSSSLAPVIAIDGPSGAGKGTVAARLAERLGWHLLDSGAVYRAAALHALDSRADLDNDAAVVAAFEGFSPRFEVGDDGVRVWLADAVGEREVTSQLRTERTADAASRVAAIPAVRAHLLEAQRSFRVLPGLIADGRDMGSVVFPDAVLKVFLTASVQERARRRAKQLKEKGNSTTLAALVAELELRDARDANRQHAPLAQVSDALCIDSSGLGVDEVVQRITDVYERR